MLCFEPTYRLEPKQVFNQSAALAVIKQITEAALSSLSTYCADTCAKATKDITEEIKRQLRRLNSGRYRVVVLVTIGRMDKQGLQIVSKCLWNDHMDVKVSYTASNRHVFCVATAYLVYKE